MEVFSNRNFRYLWVSSLFSFVGMQMQMIAGAWLAWELTHSFALVGVISVAMGLPMLLLSLVGGAVADRLNKRNVAIITQAVIFGTALATALLIVTDLISIELLFAIGLVQGVAFAFGMPARQPLIAVAVGPEQLMSAMALSNAAMNGTRLVGPALAGALIAARGVESSYFVQAALFAIGAVLLLMVPGRLGAAGGQARTGIVREIGHGLRYVARDRTLRMLLLMAFIPALFAMPYQVLLSGFVERDLGQGPEAFGLLQTVTGVGAVVGSVAMAWAIDFPRKPLLQLISGVLGGLGLVALGLGAMRWGYPGAVVAVLFIGLTLTSYQTLNMTMIMAAAAQEYYGRVMSMMMLTFSVMPLMAAPLGLLADRIGAMYLFIAEGAIVAGLLVLVSLMNPRYSFGRTGEPHAAGRSPERLADAAGDG